MNNNQIRGWLIILLVFAALFSFTNRNYAPRHSIYNNGPYGASHLYDQLRENEEALPISRLLISPFSLNELENIDFMIIIGSERSYTSAEINAYNEYVRDGGNLLVFEDFGYARDIVETMGVTYFDGVVKERNDNYYVNRPSQFIVRDYLPVIFGGSESFLFINEGAGILDARGFLDRSTLPFLWTLETAYIDTDNDNNIDENDLQLETGIPLGLLKPYGDGYLIVVSDASVPLNIHHQRKIPIVGELEDVPNIGWSSTVIKLMASLTNSTSIVFDESHQEVVLSSSSGLLNLLASTWVGIFNSENLIGGLFVAIIIFSLFLNRDIYIKMIDGFRRIRGTNITTHEFVSNPTLAERGLSEQYILYKRMGNEFIYIANMELFNQIKEIGRSKDFLEKFEKTYGEITKSRPAKELFKMHNEMRLHLSEVLIKWL